MNLSIIIPTLNEGQNIGRLIDRLLTAPNNQIEIIVVDGGSKDNTCAIAKQKGALIIQADKCRAIQMNVGAEKSANEHLYFVHADTIPPLGYYEDLRMILKKGFKAGCYRSNFIGGPWILKLNAFFTRFNWIVARGGDQSLFIEKKYFFALGKYDESMCIMEEYPLIEKMMKAKTFCILTKSIEICTRKYVDRNWLKVSRANYVAFRMYKKGGSSESIKAKYEELLNS